MITLALQRNASLCVFGYNSKQIAAACILGGVIAAGITALTNPSAVDDSSHVAISVNRAHVTISVNRAGKSDRLQLAPKGQQFKPNSAPADARRFCKSELRGCQPVVSPLSGPQFDTTKCCVA